jgi:mannosyltransferase
LTLLGGLLRFATLGSQSLWLDEAWTSYLVRMRPGAMLGAIPQTESTPPLYYLLTWVAVRVGGNGEAALRSVSALAGTLTIPIAYGIGATMATRRVGLVLAALATTSPMLVWYSQEARSYALLVALSGLSLLACARAVERPSAGRLALWLLASAAALATHYFAAFPVALEAAWLLIAIARADGAGTPPGAARRVLVAVGALGLLALPLGLLAAHQGHNGGWIAGVPLRHRVGETPLRFAAGFPPGLGAWLTWAALACAAAGVALLLARGERRERRAALVAAALGIGAIAGPLALVAGSDFFLARNVLVAWLPLALVVAAGLGARRAGPLGLAAAGVACALSLAAVVAVAATPALQRPTWRTLAERLGPLQRGRAIVLRDYGQALPSAVYRPGAWRMGGGTVRVRSLDVVSARTRTRPYCWWGAECNVIATVPRRRPPVAGFAFAGERRAGSFVIVRFTAARPVPLTARALGASERQTVLLDGRRSPVTPVR